MLSVYVAEEGCRAVARKGDALDSPTLAVLEVLVSCSAPLNESQACVPSFLCQETYSQNRLMEAC